MRQKFTIREIVVQWYLLNQITTNYYHLLQWIASMMHIKVYSATFQRFKCFDKILLGQDATKEERTEMWNGIAFYNFVQTAISGVTSNAKYTQKDYVDSSAMALEIIKELHPDYVIVWGKRAYNYLPDTDWLSEDKAYLLPNGHKVYCLRIDHPSRAHQATWSKEVKKFLEK